jgi:hypothetical protein
MPGALDPLVPAIKTLIDTFGKTVTFYTEAGAYDPATGGLTATETAVSVTVTPPEPVRDFMSGSDVKRGEIKCSFPAQDLAFTPKLGQRVVIDSQSYNIVRLVPTYTGELIGMYDIELEGGH